MSFLTKTTRMFARFKPTLVYRTLSTQSGPKQSEVTLSEATQSESIESKATQLPLSNELPLNALPLNSSQSGPKPSEATPSEAIASEAIAFKARASNELPLNTLPSNSSQHIQWEHISNFARALLIAGISICGTYYFGVKEYIKKKDADDARNFQKFMDNHHVPGKSVDYQIERKSINAALKKDILRCARYKRVYNIVGLLFIYIFLLYPCTK